jgi:hypothetical protein
MINKMSIKFIIKDHFKSFKLKDKLIFFYMPTLFASICALILSKSLTTDIINILLVSLSIFVGFLLNLLVISISIRDDKKKIELAGKIYDINYFLNEFNDNISFGVLLAVGTIIILILYTFFLPNNFYIQYFFNVITILLLSWFFMTLLMIIKRGHLLFGYYLKK